MGTVVKDHWIKFDSLGVNVTYVTNFVVRVHFDPAVDITKYGVVAIMSTLSREPEIELGWFDTIDLAEELLTDILSGKYDIS